VRSPKGLDTTRVDLNSYHASAWGARKKALDCSVFALAWFLDVRNGRWCSECEVIEARQNSLLNLNQLQHE